MKQLLLTLSAMLVCAAEIFAQPTIPATRFFIPGTTMVYVDAGFTTFNTGTPGANQTWDFSTLTNSGSGYTNQVVTTASTPYASAFPGSNVAITDPTAGLVNYTMMNTAGGGLDFQGYVVDNAGTPIQFNYSDPQRLFSFPLTYSAVSTDTYAGTQTISMPPVTLNYYRYGTTSSEVDGYGTLILPAGTYTDVLRIKMREVNTDSVLNNLTPTADVTHTITNTYIFVEDNGVNAVDRLRVQIDSTTDASGLTVKESIWFIASVTTGLTKVNNSNNFSVYPNPAVNEMYVRANEVVSGNATFSIMDITGRTIRTFTAEMLQSAPVSVPVNDLTSGAYILKAETEGGIWTTRFIRQ